MCRRLTPGSAVRYTFTLAILTAPHHSRGAWVGALPFIACAKKRVLNINGYLVSKAPCTCARSK